MEDSIADRFFRMEKKYDLFSLRENGIPIWDLMRHDIYIQYYYPPEINNSYRGNNIFTRCIMILKKIFSSIPYFLNKKGGVVIMSASRYWSANKYWYDKALMDIINYYGSTAFILEVQNRSGRYACKACFDFGLYFRKIFYTAKKISVQNFTLINKALMDSMGESKITYGGINKIYSAYLSDYLFYRAFFRLKKTKKIFFSQVFWAKGMIAAAHSLNILTYELQHGSFERDHLGYSYPGNIQKGNRSIFVPLHLLTFGEYWGRGFNVPADIIPVGNTYYNEPLFNIKEDEFIDKDCKQILIVSSKAHGNELSKLVICFIEQMEDKGNNINIIFKLHDNESGNKMFYANLFEMYKNVKVIANEQNISVLIQQADLVVAIASTTIYEALNIGKKVAIYKRGNYLELQNLFELPNVYLFDDCSELKIILNRPLSLVNEKYTFFKNFDAKMIDLL